MPGGNDTMTFTYNSHGDPVKGARKYTSTGAPDFVFKYDKYNRLTDLIGVYDFNYPDNVESWHKYFYNEYNQIVLDSFYLFPSIINGQPSISSAEYSIITYEYDIKNRISKVTTTYYGNVSPTVSYEYYSYDENSNLQGVPHDNKINLHRTNKIWMFLDRDYSVNNPAIASYNYNSFGLPVKIVFPSGSFGQFMHAGLNFLNYEQADIKYTCDIKNY